MKLESLQFWFEEEKRSFPWRENPTPYRVWVSEVMLQQTRASVVISYYQRWMKRFPDIQTLAEAPLEEVIKLWEGLGYYARARSLHEGAKYIALHHEGLLPNDPLVLEKVKGLGPYTIGAILSFAFHQKAAAVDGNVVRVISRLFCIEEEVDRPSVQKEIRQRVEDLLPENQPWVMMEALIELGALVCMRKPECSRCPLQEECLGFKRGKAEGLPKKKPRQESIALKRIVPIIYHQNEYLVQKHQGKKVMADLYEFPYFEEKENWNFFYPGKLTPGKALRKVKHTFTRYTVQLFPSLWKAEKKQEIVGFEWRPLSSLSTLPFSSGHKRILLQLVEGE